MKRSEIDPFDLDVLVMANNRNFLGWPDNPTHSSALHRLKKDGLVEKTKFGAVHPTQAGYKLLKEAST